MSDRSNTFVIRCVRRRASRTLNNVEPNRPITNPVFALAKVSAEPMTLALTSPGQAASIVQARRQELRRPFGGQGLRKVVALSQLASQFP